MFTVTPSQPFFRTGVRRFAIFVIAALAVSSCGSSDVTSTRDVEATSPQTSEAAATEDPQPETIAGTVEDSTTDESDWPGEDFELFAERGDVLSVVGVQFDDVLNVRSGPGTNFNIVATLEPTDTAVATGKAWENDTFWYEVTVGNETGWASSSFFAYLGPEDDATSEIVQPGQTLKAETMLELAELVAETQTSEDVASTVTQVSAPIVGDLGKVIYDVTGLADPASSGFRLHVFGQENETGDFFELTSVERITLCSRGLTDDVCS